MRHALIFSLMMLAIPIAQAQSGVDFTESRIRDFSIDMPFIVQIARCVPSYKEEERNAFKKFLSSSVGGRKVAFVPTLGCVSDTWALLAAQQFGFNTVVFPIGSVLRPDASF